jgi:ATP-binding cassette subfamily G (WHITE) protein 2
MLLFRITGEEYLDQQGIDHGTQWEIWQNIMALGFMAVGIMTLAFIQLVRIKKLK